MKRLLSINHAERADRLLGLRRCAEQACHRRHHGAHQRTNS
jgi:hypothetical protein